MEILPAAGKDIAFSCRRLIVRFGDVTGSGLLILFLAALDDQGEGFPITDLPITYIRITNQQADEYVIASTGMMNGGAMYVPRVPCKRVRVLP